MINPLSYPHCPQEKAYFRETKVNLNKNISFVQKDERGNKNKIFTKNY